MVVVPPPYYGGYYGGGYGYYDDDWMMGMMIGTTMVFGAAAIASDDDDNDDETTTTTTVVNVPAATAAPATLPCAPIITAVDGVTYFQCGGQHYVQAYGGTGPIYMPVPPPGTLVTPPPG
ncbi:MAG: hypothetical protein ABI616_06550 [Pseudomonadota bacterium]